MVLTSISRTRKIADVSSNNKHANRFGRTLFLWILLSVKKVYSLLVYVLGNEKTKHVDNTFLVFSRPQHIISVFGLDTVIYRFD